MRSRWVKQAELLGGSWAHTLGIAQLQFYDYPTPTMEDLSAIPCVGPWTYPRVPTPPVS